MGQPRSARVGIGQKHLSLSSVSRGSLIGGASAAVAARGPSRRTNGVSLRRLSLEGRPNYEPMPPTSTPLYARFVAVVLSHLLVRTNHFQSARSPILQPIKYMAHVPSLGWQQTRPRVNPPLEVFAERNTDQALRLRIPGPQPRLFRVPFNRRLGNHIEAEFFRHSPYDVRSDIWHSVCIRQNEGVFADCVDQAG